MSNYNTLKTADTINAISIVDGAITTSKLNASVTTLIVAGSSPKATVITYPGNDLAADTAGGQTITLTGTGFVAGCSIFIGTTQASVVTVVSATSVTFTSPALAAATYTLYLVNPDGGTATIVPGISYSGTPTWSTSAGTLGSVYEYAAISNTVAATGDGSITYSVLSGTLPTGSALNTSTGVITGTSPASAGATTYSFVVRATDAQLQDTDRSFSITVNTDVVTWTTPADNSVTTLSKDIASTTTLLATSAAGRAITYTANALPTGLSISGDTVTGTPTVAASTTSTFTATAATTGRTATRTINWTVSVVADTYFPYTTLLLSGQTSTATFVTDASTNNFSVAIFGDTKPNNFNPYTPGYYSNYFSSANYISAASNAAFGFGTGDFTVEAWVYPNAAYTTYNYIWATGATGGLVFYVLGGVLYVRTYNGSDLLASSTAPALNTWTHVAATRSGTTLRIFVNGVQTGTTTNSTNFATGSGIVGNDGANAAPWVGYISNLRVVKGTAVYTANFTPSTTPLTAITNTSLLTCQSNRFLDNSTNAFALTITGTPSVQSSTPFVPNTAYATYGSTYFDGTGDYLTAPSNAAFQFGTGDFTVEYWVNFTTIPAGGSIPLSCWSSNSGWELYYRSTSLITWWYNSNFISGTTTPKPNTWYHLAVTRSSATTRLFVNGAIEATLNSDATNFTPSSALYIGNESGSITPFTGYLTDVRIVKGTAVYTSTFTPPTVPLTAIANTSLLTLQTNQPVNNSVFLDNSTNALAITRNGNTTQGTFSPYGANWSNYFDGTGDYLSVPATSQFAFGTGNFTIEAWIYLNAYGSSIAGPQMFGTTNGQETGYSINVGQSANSFRIISNATGVWADNLVVSAGGGPSLNTWTHMCVVRQGANLTIYKNGVSVASTASATTWNFIGTTGIIGRFSDATFIRDFPGYISNLRVNSTAVYTAAFTPSTTPLTAIANTSLLTCQSNSLVDNSANAFTITKNGDTSVQRFSPFSPLSQTAITHSAYFDGTGDYLTVPSNAAFDFGSGDFTIETWFYLAGNSSPQAGNVREAILFSNDDDINNGAVVSGSIALLFTGNTTITGTGIYFYRRQTSGAWAEEFLYSAAIAQNTWHHVAVVKSGTNIKIFFNGSSVLSTTAVNTTFGTSAKPSSIGGRFITNYRSYLNGYISNLRVVKGTAVYTSNFVPPTTPLTAIANTSLLTCQSPTFVDNSTNAFALTAVGDAKPRTQNTFGFTSATAAYSAATYGASAYFDGTGDYLNSPSSSLFNLYGINWTVEGWFNLVSATSDDRLFVFAGASSSWGFYRRAATGNIYFGLMGSDEVLLGNMLLNEWTHLALVRTSGPTISLYKNGVFSGSTGAYSMPNENCTFLIAGNPAPYSNTVTKGYVSDVRVVKGTALYTSAFVPPTAPLTAITNTSLLLNMTSAGITDSTMINNLETVGDAKISTTQSKFGGSSMYFDGTGDYLAVQPNITNNLGTGDFTIELWFYIPGGITSPLAIIGNGNAGTIDNAYWSLEGVAGGNIGFFAANSATQYFATTTQPWTAGWAHIAVSRSGNNSRLFVNGVQQGSTYTTNNSFAAGGNLYIGTGPYSVSARAMPSGYINDLRITKGIARYTTTFTPPTTAFIAR